MAQFIDTIPWDDTPEERERAWAAMLRFHGFRDATANPSGEASRSSSTARRETAHPLDGGHFGKEAR